MTRRLWNATIELAFIECCRVTRHLLVVKCQDQVDSRYEWQTGRVVIFAASLGWELKAQLHLVNTIVQPGRVQRHPRNNYSTFVVLERR